MISLFRQTIVSQSICSSAYDDNANIIFPFCCRIICRIALQCHCLQSDQSQWAVQSTASCLPRDTCVPERNKRYAADGAATNGATANGHHHRRRWQQQRATQQNNGLSEMRRSLHTYRHVCVVVALRQMCQVQSFLCRAQRDGSKENAGRTGGEQWSQPTTAAEEDHGISGSACDRPGLGQESVVGGRVQSLQTHPSQFTQISNIECGHFPGFGNARRRSVTHIRIGFGDARCQQQRCGSIAIERISPATVDHTAQVGHRIAGQKHTSIEVGEKQYSDAGTDRVGQNVARTDYCQMFGCSFCYLWLHHADTGRLCWRRYRKCHFEIVAGRQLQVSADPNDSIIFCLPWKFCYN